VPPRDEIFGETHREVLAAVRTEVSFLRAAVVELQSVVREDFATTGEAELLKEGLRVLRSDVERAASELKEERVKVRAEAAAEHLRLKTEVLEAVSTKFVSHTENKWQRVFLVVLCVLAAGKYGLDIVVTIMKMIP
jgi:hypothetical protein